MSSNIHLSFSDSAGKHIDDYRFQHSFYKNLPPPNMNRIHPSRRQRIEDSKNNLDLVLPEANSIRFADERRETACCRQPGYSIETVKFDPTYEHTTFSNDLKWQPRNPKRFTTGRIGLTDSENQSLRQS